MSRLTRLAELRRALPLTAAALLLVALAFPMWRITLEAPQYAGNALAVELYAYPRLEGDVEEVQLLNQYVGFYYPDPVYLEPNYEVHENAITAPEWSLGPLAFVSVAAASVVAALLPAGRKLRLALTGLLVGAVAVFGAMFAIIQYRLYEAGHTLDPDAPLRGVESFTPPILGSYEVANISGLAWIETGGYLTIAALGLLILAFRLRDSTATVRDAPAVVRAGIARRTARLRRWRGRTDAGDGASASEVNDDA